jgi:hypothetical protein
MGIVNAYQIPFGFYERKRPFRRPRYRGTDNILDYKDKIKLSGLN